VPDAAQERVLAGHCSRRLNQHHQHVQGVAAKPYRPAVGQDRETAPTPRSTAGSEVQTAAVIVIDIFEENHRFSD
jgi:hypothetical protein